MITIEKAWEGYKKFCVHPNADEIQVNETRSAFYAGFITMFQINIKMGEPDFHEARAVNWLEALQQEINRYMRYKQQLAEAAEKAAAKEKAN